MSVKQVTNFFLSSLIIFLIEISPIFGMDSDNNTPKTSSLRKGKVDHPYIPPNLIPSSNLIAAAKSQKNVPIQYDEEDDVYYQKLDEIDNVERNKSVNLSKNQKKNYKRREKKRLAKQNIVKSKESSNYFSENMEPYTNLIEERKIYLKDFISRFAHPVEEEQLLNLDKWKKEVLKIREEKNFVKDLHSSSEIIENIECQVPYSISVPYNGTKKCGYNGWTGVCNNPVYYSGNVLHKGIVQHQHDIINHRCLCSEVDTLAQAFLKEQEKNSTLMKKYEEIYNFAKQNINFVKDDKDNEGSNKERKNISLKIPDKDAKHWQKIGEDKRVHKDNNNNNSFIKGDKNYKDGNNGEENIINLKIPDKDAKRWQKIGIGKWRYM